MTREELLYTLNEIKYYIAQNDNAYSYLDKINNVIDELKKPAIESAPQKEDFMSLAEDETVPNTLISIGTLNINSESVATEIIRKLYPPSD